MGYNTPGTRMRTKLSTATSIATIQPSAALVLLGWRVWMGKAQ